MLCLKKRALKLQNYCETTPDRVIEPLITRESEAIQSTYEASRTVTVKRWFVVWFISTRQPQCAACAGLNTPSLTDKLCVVHEEFACTNWPFKSNSYYEEYRNRHSSRYKVKGNYKLGITVWRPVQGWITWIKLRMCANPALAWPHTQPPPLHGRSTPSLTPIRIKHKK